MGQKMSIAQTESKTYSDKAPFKFVRGEESTAQNTFKKVVSIETKGDAYEATITEGTNTRTMKVDAINVTLNDSIGSYLWVRNRHPKAGDAIKALDFGISLLKEIHTVANIGNVTETVIGGVKTNIYDLNMSSPELGELGQAKVDDTGRMISMKIGNMIEMRLEPEETAKKIEQGCDLFAFSMAKIDQPLGDPRKVSGLVVEVDGKSVDKLTDGPEQKIVKGDAPAKTITVKVGNDYTQVVKATDDEIKKCVLETSRFPIKDEAIVKLAKEAVGDARTDAEKVDHLIKFVSDYVVDSLATRPMSVADILKEKKGACTEHALLFATLARASGIPTREVTGLMYMGDKFKAFGGHAWDEVVLDGNWVAVDPTWSETRADAAHIRFGDSETGMVTTMQIAGQMKIKLVEVKHAEGKDTPEPEQTEK
jgi:hypothetical protein